MTVKNALKKAGYWLSKEVASIVAPLAAVSSTASSGGDGYLDNFLAVYHVPNQLYQISKAYVVNEGIRDFTSSRFGELSDIVLNAAENIVKRPVETLTAAGIVMLGTKYLPHMIKGASILTKKFKERKSRKQEKLVPKRSY